MNFITKALVVVTVTIVGAVVWNWVDAFHLIAGLILLTVIAGAYGVCVLRRSDDDSEPVIEDEEVPSNLTRSGALGVVWSIVLLAGLGIWFAILERTPLYAGYLDRDRSDLETQLNVLEEADNYLAAAERIEQRLKQDLSKQWESELSARLYRNFVEAGRRLNIPQCVPLYTRAIDVAERYGLDSTSAEALRQGANRQSALREKCVTLQQEGRWAEVTNLLHAALVQQPDSTALAVDLYQAYLNWAASSKSLTEKKSHLETAAMLAKEHEIQPDPASAALELVQLAIQDRSQFRNQFSQSQEGHRIRTQELISRIASLATEIHPPQMREKYLQEVLHVVNSLNLGSLGGIQARLQSVAAERKHRSAFEAQVARLRKQNDHQQLVELLKKSLQDSQHASWGFPLQLWLYEALLAWGQETADLEAKVARYREILSVCKECGLDRRVPGFELSNAEARMHLKSKTRETIRLYQERGWDQALVSHLKFQMIVQPESPLDSYAKSLYAALVSWAGREHDFQHRVAIYKEAISVAQKFQLESQEATEGLAVVRAAITEEARKREPVTLPPTTRGGIHHVGLEAFPPSLIVEAWVEDPHGKAIEGLKGKDCSVRINGAPCNFLMASTEKKAVPLSVALALDTSESVAPALQAIKQGGKAFLRGIASANTEVKLLLFNSSVNPYQWTKNMDAAAATLESIQPQGKTALFQALQKAQEALRSRSGDRCIVLFTDGQNTVAGLELKDVIEACRVSGVRVWPIGLRSGKNSNLDSATLRQLATQTGGSYTEASSAAELPEKLLAISQRVRRHLYRFVTTPQGNEPNLTVTIKIGENPGVLVTEQISLPHRLQVPRSSAKGMQRENK